MKTLLLFCIVLSFPVHSQMCPTSANCYLGEEREQELRMKQQQEETSYRRELLELQKAQLRETQEEKREMKRELEQLNESQARQEERQLEEADEKQIPQDETTGETP